MHPLALLGVALVVDFDPAKVLLAVSGGVASFVTWVALGWWKERAKADTAWRASMERRVTTLEKHAAITRTRHDREDGERGRENP